MRELEFSLGALPLVVSLDGEKLARLRVGRFAAFRIRPGSYRLTMDRLGIPARVKRVAFDALKLTAGTQNYVLFGKQGELHWYDTNSPRYCLSGRCGRIGRHVRSESTTLVFGFDRLTAEEARTLMAKYEPISPECASPPVSTLCVLLADREPRRSELHAMDR
ncbi:MAG: hypothetical protein JRF15_08075 [Deltaproteobacteria bacterium]|nr:hypothetical protein [Deltaproteobacteria bacterium]